MEEVSVEVEVAEAVATKASGDARSFFDRLGSWVLGAVLVALPFAIAPISIFPVEFSKHGIFIAGIALTAILWTLARLVTGRKTMARSGIVAAAGLLLAGLLVSALLSGSFGLSFAGIGNETGTFIALASLIFALLFTVGYASDSERAAYRYILFLLASFLLVFGAQVGHLLAGPFSFIGDASGTVIGKWNDLAIFYGLAVVLGLVLIEFGMARGRLAALAWLAYILGIVGLAFTNFSIAWLVVGIFSLAVLVWGLVFGRGDEDSDRSYHIAPVVLLILAILFTFFGSAERFLGAWIFRTQAAFNVSTLEARPSWDSTITITKGVLGENAAFGNGLNRFAEAWSRFKPDPVNETLFWNVNFNAGVGWVPSFVVTGGAVVGVLWALFLAAVILGGGRIAFHRPIDSPALVLYLLSLYLWSFAFFYVPDLVILALAFVTTGMLVARGALLGVIGQRDVHIFSRPSLRFGIVLALVLFILLTALGGGIAVARAYAFSQYQRATALVNAGESLDEAEKHLARAKKYGQSDLYDRTLSEIAILKLQRTVGNPALSQDELRTQFEAHLTRAIAAARDATTRDPDNHLNWMTLGRVYTAVVAPPLRIEGAYEFAKEAFDRGLALNLKNPALLLEKARLEVNRGDLDEARKFIGESLAVKTNFAQARFLLSQLEATEGNLRAAIRAAEEAALLSPQDVGVFFQLGLLRYQSEDYVGTTQALERAVALNPSYSNARYFLGLSYAELGRRSDALAQFLEIEKLNPDNDEVKQIVRNLKSGRSALSGVASPLERATAPLEE